MRPAELGVMAPLIVLIVVLGLFPGLMIERMEPSVRSLVEHVDRAVDGFDEARYEYVGPQAREAESESGGHGGGGG
jgi:hypothetical protein